MNERLRSRQFLGVAVLAFLVGCGDGGAGGGGGSTVPHLYFSQDGNGNGLYEVDRATGAATLVGLGITATTSNTIGLTETQDPAVLLGTTWSQVATIATDGSAATALAGSVGAE